MNNFTPKNTNATVDAVEQETTSGAVRFEAFEPRVLLSGDVNPAAIAISGNLDQPGQQDHYQFTVNDTKRVVFDSLTNRDDLSWSLAGPNGQVVNRTFVDTPYGASPAYDLAAGTYTLTVDGSSDATGSYALRIIDADAAADITVGQPVTGSLTQGTQTSVYRFDATAGNKFAIDNLSVTGGQASWRLIDPYGRQEGSSQDLASLQSAFSLNTTGQYLLLVEGSNSNTTSMNYGFTLSPADDVQQDLTLDQTTNTPALKAGQVADYHFHLDADTAVLLDTLGSTSFSAMLHGPLGSVDLQATNSLNTSATALAAGDYTLSVSGTYNQAGSFAFRLLNTASAQTLSLNTATNATLDSADGTQLYAVSVNAGDKLFLAPQASAQGNVYWRVLDPYGAVVTSQYLGSGGYAFTAASSGTYWLAATGWGNAATASVGIGFSLNAVPDVTRQLDLGAAVTDSIARAGQSMVYTFDLATAVQLAFDARTARSDIQWTLTGPNGTSVAHQAFANSGPGFKILTLPAGHYSLTVNGVSGATGNYSFALQNLAAASAFTVGAPASGTLSPGNASKAYRFAANAGDQFNIAVNSTNSGAATWRLIDAYGRDVTSSQSLGTNGVPLTLNAAGSYTLLIEGASSTPVDYSLSIDALGNTASTPLPAGESLALGQVVAGALDTWDASKTYRFSVNSDSLLALDSQASSSALWSLIGPRGTEYSGVALNNEPLLKLVAGDYALTLSGASYASAYSGNGAYALQLIDLATLPALQLGQSTTASRAPANSTVGFQFQGTAGTNVQLLLNQYSSSTWVLVDPYGNVMPAQSLTGAQSRFTLLATGTYTLLDQGAYYQTGTANDSFVLAKEDISQAPLTFNDSITGNLANQATTSQYSFTLDKAAPLFMDALADSGSNVVWSVLNAQGQRVYGPYSLASDQGNTLNLAAGQYTLVLGNNQNTPASFNFRLLNGSAATPLTLGTPIVSNAAGNQTRLYRFQGNTGEQLFLQGDTGTNAHYNDYWVLVGPDGKVIQSGNAYSDVPKISLGLDGQYLLAVYPGNAMVGATAPWNISLTLGQRQTEIAALTLGTPVQGQLIQPGQSIDYSFTLDSATTLGLTTLAGTIGANWSLTGPRGSEVSSRNFEGSWPTIMNVPAGTYVLHVDNYGLQTGSFAFTLDDLASVPAITPSQTTEAMLPAPGGYLTQQVSVATDSDYGLSVPSSSIEWRVVSASGVIIANGYSPVDQTFHLGSGKYLLQWAALGEASSAAAPFNFTLVPLTVVSQPLVVGQLTQGAISTAGQTQVYTLNLSEPTSILFDSLSQRDDITWQLAGPYGAFAQHTPLSIGSTLFNLNAAGTYQLSITAKGTATGAFAFNVLDLPGAAALPIGTGQSLDLPSANASIVRQINAQAGDYLHLAIPSVDATHPLHASLVDDQGVQLLAPVVLTAGTELAIALPRTGRYSLIIEGTGQSSDPLTLNYDAELIHPAQGIAALGQAISGSTAAANVPDTWQLDLASATRFTVQTTIGAGQRWTLRDSAGQAVQTGLLGSTTPILLQAGSYRFEVQADSSAEVGDYALSLMDIAGQPALNVGQPTALHLIAGQAQVLRVTSSLALAALSLNASGAPVTVKLFDASGAALGNGTGPFDNLSIANAASLGSEFLVVINSVADADVTLEVSQTAVTATDTNALVLGAAVQGTLAAAGDSVSYRLTVGYGQTVPISALLNDLGSNGIHWKLAAGEASSAPWQDENPAAYQWLANAGDYQLIIAATTANASYNVQTLDSSAGAAQPVGPFAGQLASGQSAMALRVDVTAIRALNIALTSGTPLLWSLYNSAGFLVAQGDQTAIQLSPALDLGTYTLLVQRATPGETPAGFSFALDAQLPATVELNEALRGALGADGIAYYQVEVPIGGIVQLHDLGSDAGLNWKLVPIGADTPFAALSTEAAAQDSLENSSPFTQSLHAGMYELLITGQPGQNFAVQTVDISHAVVLPSAAATVQLPTGREAVAYTLNLASGQYLQLNLAGINGQDVSWSLLDSSGYPVDGADHGGSFLLAPFSSGDYSLVFKGHASQAVSFTLSTAPGVLPTAEAGQNISGVFASNNAQALYQLDTTTPHWLVLHDAGNTPDVQVDILRNGQIDYNNYGSGTAVVGAARLIYLPAGSAVLRVHGSTGESYSLDLSDFEQTTALADQAVSASMGNQQSVAVFSFNSDGSTPLTLSALAGDDASSIGWKIYDQSHNQQLDGSSGGTVLQALPQGTYSLVVFRTGTSSAPVTYKVSAVPVVVPKVALTLGVDQPVTLDSATGLRQDFTFTLASASRVLFQAGNTQALNADYDIVDSTGKVWSANNYFGNNGSPSPLPLVAGTYTLRLAASYYNADAAQPDFTLFDADASPVLNTAASQTVSLKSQSDISVYRIAGQPGDQLNVTLLGTAGTYNWQVISPDNQVISSSYGSSSFPLDLSVPGNYLLVLWNAYQPASVTLSTALVSHVTPAAPVAVALDTDIDGLFAAQSQTVYTLHLDTATLLTVNATSQYLPWHLSGQGLQDDGNLYYAQSLYLNAGDYRFSVENDSDQPIEQVFRLASEVAAQPINAGQSVPAQPGLYALNTLPNQTYILALAAYSNYVLYDPALQTYASLDSENGEQKVLTLPQGAGPWYLLVTYGGFNSTAATFNSVQSASLEQPRSGTLVDQGAPDYYTLDLAQDQNVDFDFASLANIVQLRVTGGTVDATVDLAAGNTNVNQLMFLSAGHYQIQVASEPWSYGNSTNYSFAVHSLEATPELPLDTATNLALIAGQTVIQRLQGQAGQRLYFNADSTNTGTATWNLKSASGVSIASGNDSTSTLLAALPETGTYYLVWTSSANTQATFSLASTLPASLPVIAPGSTLNFSASATTASTSYRLHLDKATSLLLQADMSGDSSFNWQLTSVDGSGIWNNGQTAPGVPQAVDLAAGDYLLNISSVFNDDSSLALHLIDSRSVTVIQAGQNVQATLGQGSSALFAFDALQGQWLSYTPVGMDGVSGNWYVLDSNGTQSGELGSAGSFTTDHSGRYILAFVASSAGPESSPLHFSLQEPVSSTGMTLDYAGNTTQNFSLASPTHLLVDFTQFDGNRAQWSILHDGKVVASGATNSLSDMAASIELASGDYQLSITSWGRGSVQLLDFADAKALTSGPTTGTAAVHAASLYRFTGNSGDSVLLSSNDNYSTTWQILDEFGHLVDSFGDQGGATTLPRTGTFYLVRDSYYGSDTAAQAFSFNLAVTSGAQTLAIGEAVNSQLNQSGTASYGFDVAGASTLWLSTLAGNQYLHAEIYDARGVRVYSEDTGSATRHTILLPAAGHYVLKLSSRDGSTYSRPLAFMLNDLASAPELVANAVTNVSVSQAQGAQAFRLTMADAGVFAFNALGNSSGYAAWKLFSALGEQVASGDPTDNSPSYSLPAGSYWLVLEAGQYGSPANLTFSVANTLAPLPLDTTLSGTLQNGLPMRYSVHLDAASSLSFDSLTQVAGARWRLQGSNGQVFDESLYAGSGSGTDYVSGQYRSWADYSATLAAGDYELTLYTYGSGSSPYSFRVLDGSTAIPLVLDTATTATLSPASSLQTYQVALEAGSHYFLDALPAAQTNNGSYSPRWSLLDPQGRAVFTPAQIYTTYYYQNRTGYDIDLGAVAVSGTYTLILEGNADDPSASENVVFNLLKVTDKPLVVLDTLVANPAPDLVINAVNLTPATGLQTGQTIDLQWSLENRGSLPTTGSWNDRVIVRNKDTGVILLDLSVPYDSSDARNPSIPVGQSVLRHVSLHLPDGASAAGNISITVLADSDNLLKESNPSGTAEANNAAELDVPVTLAPYADLTVRDLNLQPASGFIPGQTVAVTWTTLNQGASPVTTPWAESLEVRNVSTGKLVASFTLTDSLTDGPLAANSSRARQGSFTWPTGVDAAGDFTVQVVADSLDQVPEGNAQGDAESNNSAQVQLRVGPDLTVQNLQILTPNVQAGGLVTVTWEDWNQGSSPVAAAFNDRISVSRTDSGLVLVDTSLAYDPMATSNGALNGFIQPGEHRLRSFTFRLPDGLKGTGGLAVSVSTDQNSAGVGVIYESNLTNDAETNNNAHTSVLSAAVAYPDLTVSNLSTPALAVGGQAITLSWTVFNHGQAPANGSWSDDIILSTDSIIGNADDIVIGSVRHGGPLAAGQNYTQSATVTLPTLPDGHYTLAVRSDSRAEVTQPDTRAHTVSTANALTLAAAYADLGVVSVTAPGSAVGGDNVRVTWQVSNTGNSPTDLALWNDRVVLSRTGVPSASDIILAGSVTHAGVLAVGDSYTASATLTLPRDLVGDYTILVLTNLNNAVTENGHTANNVLGTSTALHISLAPVANLTVSDVQGPTAVRPGDATSVSYSVHNTGTAAVVGAWRDRLYLQSSDGVLREVASRFQTAGLAIGGTSTQQFDFSLPSNLPDGTYTWVVRTDADDTVYERDGEGDNQTSAQTTVTVARPNLAVSNVSGPTLATSGDTLSIHWTVSNTGGLANGGWTDQVYLSQGGKLTQLAQQIHTDALASGASYAATASIQLPLAANGDYQIVVVTDVNHTLDDAQWVDNSAQQALHINLAAHADLAVSAVQAPTTVIADPATLNVSWTVTNQGTGSGASTQWVDRVVLSTDGILGNSDDVVVGEVQHNGALAVGDQYTASLSALLPPGTTGHYSLFVITDAKAQVFENAAVANNQAQLDHSVDVMPKPYADLQVQAVTAQGSATSGQPLHVSWTVTNQGIGITDLAQWSDHVWLSSNADGSGVIANLGDANHIGQLSVQDSYTRSIDVLLPNGIQGNYYLNVQTGAPFEFTHGNDNVGHSASLPVQLAASPDLLVQQISVPTTAQEGGLVDIGWTVTNQGPASAAGSWVDVVSLVPLDETSAAVVLGTFTYDRGLPSGISYSRTEQVRLPSKIQGLYRVQVTTNAYLGGTGTQVYEYGAAGLNNTALSSGSLQVSLLSRPDLQVGNVTVPDHVTAGTSVGIQYTVQNMGPIATTGHWRDKVYLSLDGTLSGDDVLVGTYDNASALAPTESYVNSSASIDVPIQYRGDVYLIVVTDADNVVDEYPNETNNVKAAHFYVDPVPFSDLVTSSVVAPDQAVHGSNIQVNYTVTNQGSAATRGVSADINSWTDTVWLARDPRRPGANRGDVLLGSVQHTGNLAAGEDYLGQLQVAIPDNTLSGQYYITVWSDAYNTILEDTLASNINADDPTQVDNNNYKGRAISVLGITPPDLTVTQINVPANKRCWRPADLRLQRAEPGRPVHRAVDRHRVRGRQPGPEPGERSLDPGQLHAKPHPEQR